MKKVTLQHKISQESFIITVEASSERRETMILKEITKCLLKKARLEVRKT